MLYLIGRRAQQKLEVCPVAELGGEGVMSGPPAHGPTFCHLPPYYTLASTLVPRWRLRKLVTLVTLDNVQCESREDSIHNLTGHERTGTDTN